MACRKRQRPSARDFFDRPAPEACSIAEEPSERKPLDFTLPEDNAARAEEYLAALEKLGKHDLALELIRGKDEFNFIESAATKRHLYILKANHHHEGGVKGLLDLQHMATLLWGPGTKEVAQAHAVYSAPLRFKSTDTHTITTDAVYAVEFSSQRSAEIASGVVEYHLNQFLQTLTADTDRPPLLVQARIGSDRWLLKDPESSMTESKWKVVRKQIPLLRPLAKPKASPPTRTVPLPDQLAFELSQLPPSFTIPTLITNLLQLKLPSLPDHIKITTEAQSDSPVRVLLKFPERTSAVICKINIFKSGLKNEESDTIKVLIDEGDSSVADTWKIWSNAGIWEEQQIQGFAQSLNPKGGPKIEDEVDELEAESKTKTDAGDSHEIAEFFDSSDEFSDTPHSRPPRKTGTRSYRQALLARQAQVEKLIEKLTLEAEDEFLANKKAAQDARPKSAFYHVAEQVADDRKYTKLMKQLERKRETRRQLKNYRKIKELPAKIKLQRKEWRREQRLKFREGALDAGGESSGEASDGSDQESDQSEEPKERPAKRIHTNDEIYRHKFARPNEISPGDVD